MLASLASNSVPQVLTLGILGAIILRAVFIFAGAMLVEQFAWLLALFGLLLVYAGAKALYEELCHGGEHGDERAQPVLPTHTTAEPAMRISSEVKHGIGSEHINSLESNGQSDSLTCMH